MTTPADAVPVPGSDTPTWTVDDDGNPTWRHADRDWNITRHDLSRTLWTAIYPERAADEAHAALVADVRAARVHEGCGRATDTLRQARELLADLVDDEPCRFDHNGYCQAHYCSSPCINARAQAFLAEVDGGTDG